jgi:hypothetical protein
MKLDFVHPSVPAYLNQITPQARQLRGCNHDVVFLHSQGVVGLPFVPGGKYKLLGRRVKIGRAGVMARSRTSVIVETGPQGGGALSHGRRNQDETAAAVKDKSRGLWAMALRWLRHLLSVPSARDLESYYLPSVVFTPSGPLVYQAAHKSR